MTNIFENCIPDWIKSLKSMDTHCDIRAEEARSLGIYAINLPFDLTKSVVDALSDALLNDMCEKVRVEAIIALGKIYPSLKNKKLQEKTKFTLKLAKLKSKIPSMVVAKVVKEIKKKVPNFPSD